jgi:cysteine synthase
MEAKIMRISSILEAIGKTPSVRLSRIFNTYPAHEIYGKCEFLNPGGSLKDRIAVSMIKAAEAQGTIRPGDTLIEATAGNTGIGLAMAGAVLGYKIIITLSGRMSLEKQRALEAYGAVVYRTPIGLPFDHPDSHFSLARHLANTLPNAYLTDQFSNPANPEIHAKTTAQEIWEDFGDTLDYLFIGLGTGGTLMGVSRVLKEKNPKLKIIGVEPMGSLFSENFFHLQQNQKRENIHPNFSKPGPYRLEGIGQDFIPKIFNANCADQLLQVSDEDAFAMAKRLAKEEGLWVGGSSGAVAEACQQAVETFIKKPSKSLMILADTGRNY